MPRTEETRKLKTLSFSLDTYEYLIYLAKHKKNASKKADKAIQATSGFKKFKKEHGARDETEYS